MTAKKGPHLKIQEYYYGGMRKRNSQRPTYKIVVCSECEKELHPTAKFCVHCGAWFAEKKGRP